MTFDSAYWEDRYRTHPADHCPSPSPHLVAAAAHIPSGAALEAGCGEGGNAVWLAGEGWQVTAVDIAPTALRRATSYAEARGPEIARRIRWVQGDLTASHDPVAGERYDLVTSHYVHPDGPFELLAQRLAGLVGPGGTLLLVGHGPGDAHSAEHAPGHALWHPGELATLLDPAAWDLLEAGTSRREVGRGRVLQDAVLHARRR